MANTINVMSTIAQAEGFEVELNENLLLQKRYFPTSDGDLFAGKEVLFDFEDRDLEKGAYLTTTYQDGKTVNWVANAVIPPRVAISDQVDPKNLDRQLFERLCREQGTDLDRSRAFEDLKVLKALRIAQRNMRSIEELCSHVLKEGGIQFLQPHSNAVGAPDDVIDVTYYKDDKGADNHYIVKTAWGSSGATPYRDVCDMVDRIFAEGSKADDVLMGARAWQRLHNDAEFKDYYASFHVEDAMIFAREIDGTQHVGQGIFNGRPMNLLVNTSCYKDSSGHLVPFIDTDAVIVISPDVGRTLCGGVTLLNPNQPAMVSENAFMDGRGKVIESIYKNFDLNVLELRAESRPLPCPKQSINSFPWIYCDTSITDAGQSEGAFGSVVTLTYVYKSPTGSTITPSVTATPVVNRLGGSKMSISAPTHSSYTFDKFIIDGVEWAAGSDGKRVIPATNKVVIAQFKAQ